jgi:hypothetical protein
LFPLCPYTYYLTRICKTVLHRLKHVRKTWSIQTWPPGLRKRKWKVGQPQNLLVVYSFYKELMETPALAAWSFLLYFYFYLLVLPTGNALAERGFSAMGAAHSENRSELSPMSKQVLVHIPIGFNGPSISPRVQIVTLP